MLKSRCMWGWELFSRCGWSGWRNIGCIRRSYSISAEAAEKINRARSGIAADRCGGDYDRADFGVCGGAALGNPHFSRTERARNGAPGEVSAGAGEANIFIYPGYKFQVVGALLTNFHLPQSTLLMLVCALGGKENVMRAYEHAVRERYRFYSYGDCMLVE